MVDIEITTHVHRPPEALPDVLEQFAQCLDPLEADTDSLRTWLATLDWSPDGSGFGGLGHSLTLRTHGPDPMQLMAKPHVFGYTAALLPGNSIPWVELSLVLENGTEEYEVCVPDLRTYSSMWQYPRAFGVAVLEVMWRLWLGFPESGVFFADDPNVDMAWESLVIGGERLWDFDLAIVPDLLASRFGAKPDGYAHLALPGAVGFARIAAWVENPLEAVSVVIAQEGTHDA